MQVVTESSTNSDNILRCSMIIVGLEIIKVFYDFYFVCYILSYIIFIYIVYLCILYFKKQKQILKSKGLPLHLLSSLEAIHILYICKYKLTCLGYFHIKTSLPTNNLANTSACKNNLIW